MPRQPEDFLQRVARRIAETRVARGMTQEALASFLEIATKNVQRFESGKQNLTLKSVERIAKALRSSPESFFNETRAPEKNPLPDAITRLRQDGYTVHAATRSGRKPAAAIPVMSLRAAAGSLTGAGRAIDVLGWVSIPGVSKGSNFFVAEVHGVSMTPKIPERALCLFTSQVGTPLIGRIVLVEDRSLADHELGGSFAVKRVGSIKRRRNGTSTVELLSENRSVKPLTVEVGIAGELNVLAEFVRVLGAPGRTKPPRA